MPFAFGNCLSVGAYVLRVSLAGGPFLLFLALAKMLSERAGPLSFGHVRRRGQHCLRRARMPWGAGEVANLVAVLKGKTTSYDR